LDAKMTPQEVNIARDFTVKPRSGQMAPKM
jgi:hypothetical protein